jgi:hypothetical protein
MSFIFSQIFQSHLLQTKTKKASKKGNLDIQKKKQQSTLVKEWLMFFKVRSTNLQKHRTPRDSIIIYSSEFMKLLQFFFNEMKGKNYESRFNS